MTDFDLPAFVTHLRNSGLSASAADKYAVYVRAAVAAGQDPNDNAAFTSYAASFASSTRSRRRTAWRHYQRYVGADVLPDAPVAQAEEGLEGLGDFAQWLHTDRGLAESAAMAYTSIVRTALRAVGSTPTRPELEAYLDTRSMSYRARFPTVWRYWRDYSNGQAVDLEVAQSVPDAVGHAAWYLATRVGMRLANLRELCWRDLRERDDQHADVRYLPDPQPGRFYRQRVEPVILAALREWALPHDDDAPVLPADRGGASPMTRRQIHDVVTRGAELVAQGYRASMPHAASTRPTMRVPWNSDVQDTPTPWKPENADFGAKIEG